MAQSPGDGSSRGLCLLQIITQEVLSLGKLSRLEHLHRGALPLAVAFVCSGRYVISGDGGSLGRQRGYDLCVTRTPRTP